VATAAAVRGTAAEDACKSQLLLKFCDFPDSPVGEQDDSK
jgi:hypothetical protein